MQHRLFRLHNFVFWGRYICSEELLSLLLVLLVFVVPAAASTRLIDRGLYMNSTLPGVTTSYTVSFGYVSPEPIGSVDMLFCEDPIPIDTCVTPPGLDASQAVLSSQTGETGFSILSESTNHIVLTRTTQAVTTNASSYTFDGIVNPTDSAKSFAIRLQSHSSTDASGPQVDFGSVDGQVTNALVLETQVPPMLIFCAAQEVEDNCTGTDDTYYKDMGTLDPDSTLVAQSQMAVGTNASRGFVITANGASLSAGTNVISALSTPTESVPGTNQFGINLVANNAPAIGEDPEGTFANALPTTNYGDPNHYMYQSGDVVAESPDVSLMKKFTVSYILNASPNLHAGVYSTTITYIASGRF